MSTAVFELPPPDAVMLTVVLALTVAVEIATVADVDPAATVTLLFGATTGLSLVIATTRPPVGAGPISVTVAVEDTPPLTVAGFSISFDTDGAITERLLLLVTP